MGRLLRVIGPATFSGLSSAPASGELSFSSTPVGKCGVPLSPFCLHARVHAKILRCARHNWPSRWHVGTLLNERHSPMPRTYLPDRSFPSPRPRSPHYMYVYV
jgi:hypothetical protein